IADPDLSETLQKDFASIGFDNLQLNVPSDQAEQYFNDSYKNIAPEDFTENAEDKSVLDVRSTAEYKEENLNKAEHIHFGHIQDKEIPFDKEEEIYIHCQTGVRSAIAMSVLKARGFDNVINIEKGYAGIKEALR